MDVVFGDKEREEERALALAEKRALLGSPASDTLSPDVLRLIAASFSRDPYSFYALAATCRLAAAALGDDFYPYADTAHMPLWIARLIWRTNKAAAAARCMYLMQWRYDLGRAPPLRYWVLRWEKVGNAVAQVDLVSGIVLNDACTRAAGYVHTRQPENFFYYPGFGVRLKGYKEMLDDDAAYKDDCKKYWKQFTDTTAAVKKMPLHKKKRLFSEAWLSHETMRKRPRRDQ
jgi:hypothetical protein